eukprot:13146585-Alexandrium_andersonii.AAC.1
MSDFPSDTETEASDGPSHLEGECPDEGVLKERVNEQWRSLAPNAQQWRRALQAGVDEAWSQWS